MKTTLMYFMEGEVAAISLPTPRSSPRPQAGFEAYAIPLPAPEFSPDNFQRGFVW